MKSFASVLVAFALASTVTSAQAATTAHATLTVSGHASIAHMPDRATIPVTIVTNDDNASRALSQNNAKYRSIVNALATRNILATAIKTTGFDSQFNARPSTPNPQFAQRYGSIVTRSLAIEIDDLGAVGGAIDAVTAAAAPEIGGVAYGLRDAGSAERAAQAAAIRDALLQAQTQAAAAGVRIVRVLNIGAAAPPNFQPRVLSLAMAKAAANVPTDLPPSDLTIDATITVTYEISDAAH